MVRNKMRQNQFVLLKKKYENNLKFNIRISELISLFGNVKSFSMKNFLGNIKIKKNKDQKDFNIQK
jgi:hypothetical protein